MRKKIIISNFVVALFMAFGLTKVCSANFNDAVEAYERGDYKIAFQQFSQLAKDGDIDAQLNLAIMYKKGLGVPKDELQSAKWYFKAAEQGDSQAQLNLGAMFAHGEGVIKDELQAYFWWLLASSKGDEKARSNLNAIEKNLTPNQRLQVQAEARNWQPKKANEVISESDIFAPKTKPEKSSGSGFVVAKGFIVTNAHVVDGCNNIKVNGKNSTINTTDSNNDLALLNTNLNNSIATIRQNIISQGDEVSAIGYPLYGLLASGPQITYGNISALAGMYNDSRFIQITAPIQPGNSGGPLVDSSGNITGVVVSKLNALSIAKINGDIPQNINFAISPLVLKGFLDASGVKYKTALSNKKHTNQNIMTTAKQYTVLIECTK